MPTFKETILQGPLDTRKFIFTVLRAFIEDYLNINRLDGGTLARSYLCIYACDALHVKNKSHQAYVKTSVANLLTTLVNVGLLTPLSATNIQHPDSQKFRLSDRAVDEIKRLQRQNYAADSRSGMESILEAFEDTQTQPQPSQVTTVMNDMPLFDTSAPVAPAAAANTNLSVTEIIENLNSYRSDQTRHLPNQLLADLVRANATSPETAVSGRRLDWPSGSYKRAAAVLCSLGLTCSSVRTVDVGNGPHQRRYGLWLTPLGAQVGAAGNFVVNFPPVARTPMGLRVAEKGAKKFAATPKGRVVYAKVNQPNGSVLEICDPELAMALARGVTPSPELLAAATREEEPAVTTVEEEIPVIDKFKTVGAIISGAVTGIYSGISDAVAKESDTPAQTNMRAVALAMGRLNEVVNGFRVYVNFCRAHNIEIDMEFLSQYCDDVVRGMDGLEDTRRIMKLDFDRVEGFKQARDLDGAEMAIKVEKWPGCNKLARELKTTTVAS